MIAMQDYLLEGELVWCIPEKENNIQSGKLYIKTKDSTNKLTMMPIGGSSNTSGNNDQEYLTELTNIEKIDWLTSNLQTYRMYVNDNGKIIVNLIEGL